MESIVKMKDRYIGATNHHSLGYCDMYCDDEKETYYLINSKNEIQKIMVSFES